MFKDKICHLTYNLWVLKCRLIHKSLTELKKKFDLVNAYTSIKIPLAPVEISLLAVIISHGARLSSSSVIQFPLLSSSSNQPAGARGIVGMQHSGSCVHQSHR